MKGLAMGCDRNGEQTGGMMRAAKGFTLIELIGVLAIIAILSALIVPSVIEQVYRAAGDTEGGNLDAIAKGIERGVQNSSPKLIPGTAVAACGGGAFPAWVCVAAGETNIGPAQINTNERGQPRYYLWDTAGVPALAAGGFTQAPAGTTGPITQRIMLVSSVGSPIAGIASGGIATANFDTLWNWDGRSQSAAVAALVGIAAARLPGDLKVARLNLGSIFHPVVVNPADIYDAAFYSIDGSASSGVAILANTFFVHGTNIALQDWTAATLSVRTITTAASFTFRADTSCACVATGKAGGGGGTCSVDCAGAVTNNCTGPASPVVGGISCYWTSP